MTRSAVRIRSALLTRPAVLAALLLLTGCGARSILDDIPPGAAAGGTGGGTSGEGAMGGALTGGSPGGGATGGGAGPGGFGPGGGGPGGSTGTPIEVDLIDDFADFDMVLPRLGGRAGVWGTYSDGTSNPALSAETGELTFTDSPALVWGAGFGVNFNDRGAGPQLYDVSGWEGVRFKARTALGVAARAYRVEMKDRYTDQLGGVCQVCYDNFGTSFTVGEETQTFTFRWGELTQRGFGDPRPAFVPAESYGMQFSATNGKAVGLVIDDLELFRGGDGGGGTTGKGEPCPSVDSTTPVERHGTLSVKGTDLLDSSGRVTQLRGVSSMWLNWEDDGFAESYEALRWMRDNWRIDVIRAAMGVEPDGAYLTDPAKARTQVETIVKNAVALGLYVIIDWHDHDALAHVDAAEKFFDDMASSWGKTPNVLFETFNEPLALDWSTELKPYHERIVKRVRDRGATNPIILGTPNWSQDVDTAAFDPVAGPNLLYALHFYACTHGDWLIGKARDARSRGLPLFVSEWGATSADGGLDGIVCETEANAWFDWMNGASVSWAAWKLDNCTPDSTCFLAPNAPRDGGWVAAQLRGQGPYLVDKLCGR